MAHVLAKDLREAILQAAVQGKLSKKEETDSSIETIIESLHFDAKIEKNEEPCDIPVHWRWIQIGNLGETNDTSSFADGPFGSNLKKEHQINQPEVRIIQLSNIGENGWIDNNIKYTSHNHLKTISRCEVKPGDFVIAKMMPAGRTIIVPEMQTKIVLGSDAVKFVPNKCLNKDYLLLAMKSNCFLSQVYSEVHGITRVRTSLNKIKSYYIPLPPIEEQARIVAKVDELMAKIDEYEKLEKELTELKEKFPEEIRDAILQAAMEGKLSERKDNDTKPLCNNNVETDEYDSYFPTEWSIVKLRDISNIYTGNSIPETVKKSKYMGLKEGLDYIGTKDVGFDHKVDYKNGVKIPLDEPNFKTAYKNATLLCIEGGSAGKKISMITENVCFGNKLCSFNPTKNINSKYQYYLLQSPIFKKQFSSNISGMIGGVSVNKLKELLVPLPPIEEQQRIVDKLDKLLPMCDELVNLC